MRDSIYIVATPYQAILATIIAAYIDKNQNKILVVSPHFKDYEKIFDAIAEWNKNPFSEIRILEDRSNYSTINKMRKIYQNLGMIKKIMHARNSVHGYIFSLGQAENMFLAHLIKKHGGRNTYVEDGSMVYCGRKLMKNPLHRKIIKRLIYGSWYLMGDSELDAKAVDDALLLHPELILDKPKNVELNKIPNEYFKSLEKDGFIRILLKKFDLDNMGQVDGIIVAPYFSGLERADTEKLIGLYSYVIDEFKKRNKMLVIKYHPRESNKDILRIENKGKTLPKALPLEVAFYNLKEDGIVIGDMSTALYTSKIIKPQATAISLMKLADIRVDELSRFLLACRGVVMPDSIEELEVALKKKIGTTNFSSCKDKTNNHVGV